MRGTVDGRDEGLRLMDGPSMRKGDVRLSLIVLLLS